MSTHIDVKAVDLDWKTLMNNVQYVGVRKRLNKSIPLSAILHVSEATVLGLTMPLKKTDKVRLCVVIDLDTEETARTIPLANGSRACGGGQQPLHYHGRWTTGGWVSGHHRQVAAVPVLVPEPHRVTMSPQWCLCYQNYLKALMNNANDDALKVLVLTNDAFDGRYQVFKRRKFWLKMAQEDKSAKCVVPMLTIHQHPPPCGNSATWGRVSGSMEIPTSMGAGFYQNPCDVAKYQQGVWVPCNENYLVPLAKQVFNNRNDANNLVISAIDTAAVLQYQRP